MLFASQIGDFFAHHWNVVILIGVIYFLLQTGLCAAFYFRMRRQERMLNQLDQDLRQGGDGRANIDIYAARFPWLRWVHQIFPAETKTPGNYTRDDVLQELDTRIASSSDYLFLQRMGIMAPLLGVILTVLGFFWLKVPEDSEQSFNQLLFIVTPLVLGVGTGAVLALINQGLLHLAGVKSESVRMAARTWFDRAIWTHLGLDTQAATVKAVAGIEKMAATVSESAEKQKESTQWLADSTLAIQEAATDFCAIVQQLGGEVQNLPEQLGGMREALGSSVEVIQSLIPTAERVVAGLDVSVSAFRTAVESQFIEAARLHRTAIGDISGSAERLQRSTEHLETGSATLHDAVSSHNQSFEELGRVLRHSLERELVPAHRKLQEAVASFDDRVEDFSACMRSLRTTADGLAENIQAASHDIGSLAGEMGPAVTSFRAAIDDGFTAASREQHSQLQSLGASVDQLHEAGQSLARGAAAIAEMIDRHAGLAEQVEPSHEALRAAMGTITAAGADLQTAIANQVAPSRQAAAAVQSLAASADRLSKFVEQGLDPATERLVALSGTLSELEGTVGAIREFTGARGEIEKLSRALAQAAEVAEAIQALPEQIRHVLEEVVETHQSEIINSRGNWLGWLRSGGPGRARETAEK